MMWFFKRCIDCTHLCTGKCELCGKPLCFECAGGVFQLHGYSPGFQKCKACKDEIYQAVKHSLLDSRYRSPIISEGIEYD